MVKCDKKATFPYSATINLNLPLICATGPNPSSDLFAVESIRTPSGPGEPRKEVHNIPILPTPSAPTRTSLWCPPLTPPPPVLKVDRERPEARDEVPAQRRVAGMQEGRCVAAAETWTEALAVGKESNCFAPFSPKMLKERPCLKELLAKLDGVGSEGVRTARSGALSAAPTSIRLHI
mmetsp:Transcript_37149/g.90216  ORF Transcript_37149/g.90216 Transcript_37149/m.90216 type:complete len:178 (-) Transcript_37149:42-575(-)